MQGGRERVIGLRGWHGGAGWTRTSDNAIMSRALYHLSYGTSSAGRDWNPSARLRLAP